MDNLIGINHRLNDKIGIVTLGNLLHCNEGFGMRTLNNLRQVLPSNIELFVDGTSGMALLEFLESKTHLIVLDAVNSHELSYAEILYWTHFIGAVPTEIVVIGFEEQLPSIIQKIVDCLWEWGAIQEKILC